MSEATTKYTWGDDSPWTPGDAKFAIEEGETLNQPIFLQEILGPPDGEVAAFVEYHPLGRDEDNASGQDVLRRLNAHDALVAAAKAALSLLNNIGTGKWAKTPAGDKLRAAIALAESV